MFKWETYFRKLNAIPSNQSTTVLFFLPDASLLSSQLSGDGSDSQREHVIDFLIKEVK